MIYSVTVYESPAKNNHCKQYADCKWESTYMKDFKSIKEPKVSYSMHSAYVMRQMSNVWSLRNRITPNATGQNGSKSHNTLPCYIIRLHF